MVKVGNRFRLGDQVFVKGESWGYHPSIYLRNGIITGISQGTYSIDFEDNSAAWFSDDDLELIYRPDYLPMKWTPSL